MANYASTNVKLIKKHGKTSFDSEFNRLCDTFDDRMRVLCLRNATRDLIIFQQCQMFIK